MTEMKSFPLIAPSNMRPQQPVLDEPLDIDRGQKVLSPPFEAYSEPSRPEINILVDEPEPTVMPKIPISVETFEPTLVSSVSEMAETVAPVTLVEEALAPEPTQIEKPSKRLTPFQRLIVALLVVVVALLLTIVYLYLTGRIELRSDIMPTVEAWLDQDLIKRFLP